MPFLFFSQEITVENGGSLTGEPGSQISGDITNDGSVEPSEFVLTGDFVQTENGTYKSTITNGVDASVITVDGNVTLDGALVIDEVTNGPTAVEDVYVLVNYNGTINGTFSSISLPPAYNDYIVDYGNFQSGAVVLGRAALLPVKLISFTAVKNENVVDLQWTTASEVENKGFNVQHGTNGIDWQNIYWIDGRGNSQTENTYEFVHQSPVIGTNYYRLEQVDFNGETDYSNIEKVTFQHDGREVALIVYPNPVNSQFSIQLGNENSIAQIEIFDANGVLRLSTEFQNGESVDISNLESAMYFIKILLDGGNSIVTSIVKE